MTFERFHPEFLTMAGAYLGHNQSLVSLPEEATAEVDKFKSALRKMYKKMEKVPVFFERNFRSQHMQVQVVPVHKEDAVPVKKAFLETASRLEVDLNEVGAFLIFQMCSKCT